MLVEEIRKRITAAMREKRVLERDILRLALAEIQAQGDRTGKEVSEDEAAKIVKKLIKSNEETIGHTSIAETKAKLTEENQILASLLPQAWDVAKIMSALAAVEAEIKGAKAEGPATGIAMKTLKAQGAPVEAKDVAEAVKKIRG
ncbi:MAG: GatB/YqeY domain-containing protein [Myxococcota bacterium]